MTWNPVVTFGLGVTVMAMKAKGGRVSLRDQLELTKMTLRSVPRDEAAVFAVLEFLEDVNHHTMYAGSALHNFLLGWLDEVSPRESEDILAGGGVAALFDWQKRKDTGL